MSAYVVGRAHIRYMVEAALARSLFAPHDSLSWIWDVNRDTGGYKRGNLAPSDYQEAARVGQMLWDENIASVLHRYPQDTRETMPGPCDETFEYAEHGPGFARLPDIEPCQVISAIGCYEYQACEHPGWDKSEAKAFCQALKEAAMNRLVDLEEERREREGLPGLLREIRELHAA